MNDELAELQRRRLQEKSEEQQLHAQIAQLDAVVKSKLSREALQRYSNIKVAHQELWLQSLVMLAQLIQAGKIQTITDAQYRAVLEKLQPKKREMQIRKV